MGFPENLATIRKERGLSQQQLGEKVSIDKRLISRYETGKTAPSIDVAIALAKALNVSLDWLTDLDYSLFVDDAELTNLLKNYDQLDPDDQATIKKILKAFSIYSKIEHTQQQLVGQ